MHTYNYAYYKYLTRSSCGRPDSIMDSHTTGPRLGGYSTLSTKLLTDLYQDSIMARQSEYGEHHFCFSNTFSYN